MKLKDLVGHAYDLGMDDNVQFCILLHELGKEKLVNEEPFITFKGYQWGLNPEILEYMVLSFYPTDGELVVVVVDKKEGKQLTDAVWIDAEERKPKDGTTDLICTVDVDGIKRVFSNIDYENGKWYYNGVLFPDKVLAWLDNLKVYEG